MVTASGLLSLPLAYLEDTIAGSSNFRTWTSTATAALFTYSFMKLKINRPLSFPLGFLGGALLGGIAMGIAVGVCTAIAVPTGALQMNPQGEWIDTWWEGFGLGFMAGGFNGLIVGSLCGLIAGPVISFSFKY